MITRRRFLTGSAAALAAGSAVTLDRAPAFAQKRELTMLSFNHFVPASDDELKRQCEVFGKQAGVTVRLDTIQGPQLFAKRAAEVSSQSGHDIIVTGAADPFLYEQHLVDVGDIVDYLGGRYGGWQRFAKDTCYTASGWRAVPWFWVAFPGCYNQTQFKKAGLEPPKTWDELLKAGKILKKQGNPVGIAISHCTDANISFWSVLWSYGGKVLETDGKTPAINSDKAAQVVEWYKELYKDAMEPEVLSWDNASNNRFLLSGKGSWIHNAISPYVAAVEKKMPIADEINHHASPAGPAGIHCATTVNSMGIWKFSKNVPLAKDFFKFLFQKENYDSFIAGASAFNMPPLKQFAEHPIWA
ncbi:MAG: hypothetical protein DMD81_26370, partial [Candidatus Rokuibacteriota bacterium]